MRKVSATVIYKGGMIYNLTVNHKGSHIPLIQYDLEGVKPYKHRGFNDMYASVLQIIKHNRFYCSKRTDFGADWYDIMWIDLDTPTRIEKFGFKEN